MRKATATYIAPPGDNKVVEMGGVTFFDGKSVDLNDYDHPLLLSKLQNNPYFDVEIGKEDDQPPPKAKRGRTSNADIAAAKEAAEKLEREAADAKTRADAAKSDHEKLSSATDREVTRPPAEGAKADLKAGMSQATGHDFEKDRQDEIARRDAQGLPVVGVTDKDFIGGAGERPAGERPIGKTT
jgi:hypothetical protein